MSRIIFFREKTYKNTSRIIFFEGKNTSLMIKTQLHFKIKEKIIGMDPSKNMVNEGYIRRLV